jgi:hypothetical protein
MIDKYIINNYKCNIINNIFINKITHKCIDLNKKIYNNFQ